MGEQKTDGLSLLTRINVVLSFLFMLIAVPFVLWLLALVMVPNLAMTPHWDHLILTYPFYFVPVGILAIGAVLGYGNAWRYYKRAKSKLSK